MNETFYSCVCLLSRLETKCEKKDPTRRTATTKKKKENENRFEIKRKFTKKYDNQSEEKKFYRFIFGLYDIHILPFQNHFDKNHFNRALFGLYPIIISSKYEAKWHKHEWMWYFRWHFIFTAKRKLHSHSHITALQYIAVCTWTISDFSK